jgi:hypothetical protein
MDAFGYEGPTCVDLNAVPANAKCDDPARRVFVLGSYPAEVVCEL